MGHVVPIRQLTSLLDKKYQEYFGVLCTRILCLRPEELNIVLDDKAGEITIRVESAGTIRVLTVNLGAIEFSTDQEEKAISDATFLSQGE